MLLFVDVSIVLMMPFNFILLFVMFRIFMKKVEYWRKRRRFDRRYFET
jgi:Na+/alanine symporter